MVREADNALSSTFDSSTEDLIHRLLKRAEIRRQISTRKSVQEGKPDRIADLLEEAARELKRWAPMTHQEYLDDKGA